MRFYCLVIALTFLTANASDSWGQSKRPPQDKNQTQRTEQPTATDQRGTPQSPAIVKILPSEDAEAKAKQEAEDRAAKNRLDTNTIRLTIAAIVVAILQFIGISIQAYYLKGTLRATAAAAQAAIDAAALASQHERAYMFTGPAEDGGITIDDEQSTLVVQFEIENSGRTVGILKRLRLGFTTEEPTSQTAAYVGDGFMNFDFDLAIRAGRKHIYTNPMQSPLPPITTFVVGYIDYIDIFKNPHFSRFCVRIDPDGSYQAVGPPSWNDWS